MIDNIYITTSLVCAPKKCLTFLTFQLNLCHLCLLHIILNIKIIQVVILYITRYVGNYTTCVRINFIFLRIVYIYFISVQQFILEQYFIGTLLYCIIMLFLFIKSQTKAYLTHRFSASFVYFSTEPEKYVFQQAKPSQRNYVKVGSQTE